MPSDDGVIVGGVVSDAKSGGKIRIDYKPEIGAIEIGIRPTFAIKETVGRIAFNDFTERIGEIIIEASRVSREMERALLRQVDEAAKHGS
jgi:hypothetical protein